MAFFASLAASLAYGIAVIVPNVSAVVASITALLSVRATFHETIQEGVRQLIGTLLGAGMGVALLAFFDFSPIVLFIALMTAYLVGRLLKLGDEGGLSIGVTVILVMGMHMNNDQVESRFLGVVLGAVLALAFSFYVSRGTPQSRTLQKSLNYSREISVLLNDISGAMHKRADGLSIPQSLVMQWLNQAEEVQRNLEVLIKESEGVIAGSKWSPLVKREEAEQVAAQCRIAYSISITVVGMCRTLVSSDETLPLDNELAERLGYMLGAAAEAVEGQAQSAAASPAVTLASSAPTLQALSEARTATKDHVKDIEETGALLLGSALLQDGAVIASLVSSDSTNENVSQNAPISLVSPPGLKRST